MAAEEAEVKELWGVSFSIAPQGLSEEQVVSFVNELMEKSAAEREKHEKQASLLKLAEQTVVEADRLAETIKQRARDESQAEAAVIRAEAETSAQEDARKIIAAAEQEAAAQSSAAIAKAQGEGQKLILEATAESSAAIAKARGEGQELTLKAQAEGQRILEDSRGRVASTEAEAKLEAEFIVRRMTQKVSEGIRQAVAETCNDLLPALDDIVKERSEQRESGGAEEKPSPRARGRSSDDC